jgi:hypothetical protein
MKKTAYLNRRSAMSLVNISDISRALPAQHKASQASRLARFWRERRRTAPGLLGLLAIAVIDTFVSQVLQLTDIRSGSSVLGSYSPGQPLGAGLSIQGVPLGPVEVVFIVALVAWLAGSKHVIRKVYYAACVFATLSVLLDTAFVITTITHRTGNEGASILMLDAALVWFMNVIVYSTWYWMIDAGGPDLRGTKAQRRPDMLFTQQGELIPGYEHWHPGFNDYLHIAFEVSLSFAVSNMDPLSRRAKNLSILQAMTSVTILVLLAARAVGTFTA